MPAWSTGFSDRTVKVGLALLFAAVVCLQLLSHLPATQQGRPYENWDELTGYNTSFVLSGPTDTSFRYGSLDTLLQWIAVINYNYFDPIGREFPHLRYANNAPPSWDDPLVAYKPKSWKGIDYSGFRGIDDHDALFASRQLHMFAVYAAVLAIGLASIAVLGGASAFILAPLLAIIVAPATYFHATQSLPNATNAVLTFGVVLFAMIYCDRWRLRYLLFGVALLAIGMNFKMDILVAAGAPMLALLYSAMRRGILSSLRAMFWCFLVGAAVTVATRPELYMSDPVMDIRVRFKWLVYIAGSTIWERNRWENWHQFQAFLESAILWPGAGPSFVLVGVCVTLLAILVAAMVRWRGRALILVVGAAVAIVSWVTAVLETPIAEQHYYFNGLSAFLATVAMALIFAYRRGGNARIAAQAGLACIAGISIFHATTLAGETRARSQLYAKYEGLDPGHNRNRASLDAVGIVQQGNFAPTILVDQHAYVDLRLFRLRGLDARYVNLNTLGTVLAKLDPSRSYIVIFSRGNFDRGDGHLRGWEGDWSPEMENAYKAYQSRLMALPVLRHYPGTPQPILSSAPIRPKDEVFISVLKPGAVRRPDVQGPQP